MAHPAQGFGKVSFVLALDLGFFRETLQFIEDEKGYGFLDCFDVVFRRIGKGEGPAQGSLLELNARNLIQLGSF
jgi:hypothetical protein